MSDGLDGLAAGLSAIAFASLALALYARMSAASVAAGAPPSVAVATLSVAAAAASVGFLAYNRHPAQVFMGNVASMALGAGLAVLAIVAGVWWLLPILGAVFLSEVISVIVQVGFFRFSGGRRVFRMAPFHHHFELGGWPETAVVRRFWLFGVLAGLASIAIAAI